ncbi:hypothetical protein H6P81_011371 [Aristolochia fimbriata]|uniref:Homeobox domain-containing protein n=1 Tax=Aristolochia fimbriata TaxID=158543 RepID=A0AAV7EU86_ARIFI|nr:hypothetical protein H6P81_011371 [Aristolochia fimbriata]
MEEEEDDLCDTGLVLGIGSARFSAAGCSSEVGRRSSTPVPVKFHVLFPSHREKRGEEEEQDADRGWSSKTTDEEEESRNSGSVEVNNGGNVPRKKLRLSKEQTAVLEESFKRHNTLSPSQKGELAGRLNLRPRQVEVWFQNRRARTKLKQTEVDCEVLKKCCESLSDENRRLKKEVQELRWIKLGTGTGTPFYIHLPRGPISSNVSTAAAAAVCPSCQKLKPPLDGNMQQH